MQKPQIDVRDKGFKNLPPINVALSKVFNKISPMETEIVNLREVSHYSIRILAEDVKAKHTVPNFTKSTMDGYAVRSEDIINVPTTLEVVEELLINMKPSKNLLKNQAIRVATGGVVPDEADCVIKVEDVKASSDSLPYTITISEPIESGRNISHKGEDYNKGDLVFTKGRLLQPVDIGVLLTIGVSSVKCYKIPKIGIIATGDEVIDEDRELQPGEVYESNTYVLMQYLTELGFLAKRYKIVKDDYTKIKDQIIQISNENDMIITTGGTSVGKKDLTPLILNELAEVIVHGVSIKPGSPTTFGIKDKKCFLGLPGFPVSSLISFAFFGMSVLLFQLGAKDVGFLKIKATMAESHESIKKRTDYLRVYVKTENNSITAYPITVGGSSLLHTLSESNGIVVIDDNTDEIPKGTLVDVIMIDKLVNYRIE